MVSVLGINIIAQEELKITGQFINSDVTYVKDVCLTI